MNEHERDIAGLPFPEATQELEDRMQRLFAASQPQPSDSFVQLMDDSSTVSRSKLTISGGTLMKLSTVACVVAAFVLLAFSLNSKSVAFADVAEKAKAVQTIQYVFHRVYFEEHPIGAVPVQQPDGVYVMRQDIRQVTVETADKLESQLRNTTDEQTASELKLRIELLRHHVDDDKPILEHAVRVRAALGGKERREAIFPPGGDSISNGNTGLQISLDDIRKKRFVLHRTLVQQDGTESRQTALDDDVINALISVPMDAVASLGERNMQGQRAVGFRLTEKMNGGTVYRDYWIDSSTRLPIQIESRFFEAEAKTPTIYSVYDHFTFDEPLKEELFSTDLPPGYTSESAEVKFYASPENETGTEENP